MKIESPVLKRLGPVPFWRGEKKCLDELNRIYETARRRALETLSSLPPEEAPRSSHSGAAML